MGADVLAGLAGVTVAVWEWARATFAWSDALTGGLALAAGIAAWVAIKQNQKSRTIAREAKDAAERGNVIAEGAKTAAEKANDIAERMETLAREANEFSKRALSTGEGANEIAVEANGVARAANTLAREANDLFKQQDERDTERHDVRWDGGFVRPGVYQLTNKGEHTAYKVVATVAYGGDERQTKAAEVLGGGSLEFELPEARKEYLKRCAQIQELESAKRYRAEVRAPAGEVTSRWQVKADGFDDQIQDIQMLTDQVGEYVQWESELGVQRGPHRESRQCPHWSGEL